MESVAPHLPLVIGHRGASGYRPEHTAEAYRLAFELGADAVEPDVVFSLDGVPVVRHENEISGTTDVAAHPEFAARHTSRTVDGIEESGWFTEDFTWAELQTLRARERLPKVRPESAAYDDRFEVLRLAEVLAIADEASAARGVPLAVVVEVKHATHFGSRGFDVVALLRAELAAAGWDARPEQLILESFEQTVLDELRATGLPGRYIYLVEDAGAAFDLVTRDGAEAVSYAEQLTDAGLAPLAGAVDGISVDKSLILPRDARGAALPVTDVVARAHRAGLAVFTWTLRSEKRFVPRDLSWEEEYALILGSGVDGVFADQPDLAIAVRGRAYT
ncbi:glycerophosphodiester phosphodiesterase family protein [Herbiconiux moechotypicola]|uniref:glycerophosphodiester phosphodiesterase n=1 Tax=Herbiconiux moechotypicola TaxID=637393 RepID=A0ABN3DSE0_9MICO|nr:glycerophosphodiester phosphodiesterase family protein [Herbiconiux moechotypicola]MCS5730619.1 glycerophosphodiester phosphodiesterase family protein [Herbiconiux moechotypicola]